MHTVQDCTVIVTGSTKGIGRAVAFAFAKHHARVVLNGRQQDADVDEFVRDARSLGGDAVYVPADVTVESHVDRLFAEGERAFGPVDILVNNVGSAIGCRLDAASLDHWTRMFSLNLLTAVMCSRRALPSMRRRRKGAIINTASFRGLRENGHPSIVAYSAAKAALLSFTTTLAKESAPDVTVNAIAPGYVQTSNHSRLPRAVTSEWIRRTPMKSFVDLEELAQCYVRVATSRSMTGAILVLDGGASLNEK